MMQYPARQEFHQGFLDFAIDWDHRFDLGSIGFTPKFLT
jgi:hypothetical protein